MFKRERAVVTKATETAKRSINTSLVISTLALIVAVIALIIAVI